jgi:glycoside/pentoside/hexuronide:cation symporter, GPH family
LPIAALGLPLVVYLPPYYAGTLGLPLATVGFLFAFVRIVDIPLDPLLGA